ncbi:MAG: nuclear transport factor 2 family protein [Deltaproteobacteria bacterium]|nr:nuclear transport factor 2 family protein [Deltaproteobacteria bacterium]
MSRARGGSLGDVRAIRALLERYAEAVDARDLGGVASCFTEDAAYEGSLAGSDIRSALPDLATRWQEYERTRHSIGCQLVELPRPGERGPFEAHAETYVSVRQQRRRDGRLEGRWVVLVYRDDLVRAPAEGRPAAASPWRIARRRVHTYFRLDWSHTTH